MQKNNGRGSRLLFLFLLAGLIGSVGCGPGDTPEEPSQQQEQQDDEQDDDETLGDIAVTTQPPVEVEIGESFDVAFEVLDEDGDRADIEDVDISVEPSEGEFADGVEATASSDDSGVAHFELAIDDAAEDVVVTATSDHDDLRGASADTQAFNVVAPGPTDLVFDAQPPGEVTAGESFDVAIAGVNDEGDTFEEEGIDISVALNQGEFADGNDVAEAATDESGLASFELVIEQADTDLVLTASSDDEILQGASANSESFDVLAADVYADNSDISGEDGIADGQTDAEIVIELADQFENPVAGITPEFEASGGGNDYGDCSESDEYGEAICSMTSTEPGDKTLEITDPVEVTGETIEFVCADSLADCSGMCVDLAADLENCGGCGIACDSYPDNSSPICTPDGCDFDCDSGHEACDGQCLSVSDFLNDVDNCGSCGNVCDSYPDNSSPFCEGGGCDYECDSGYDDCSGECVDFDSDPNNCGDCGTVCDDNPNNSSPVCTSEGCDFECDSGYKACGDECIPDDECCQSTDYSGEFGGGDGSTGDPYLICSFGHLSDVGDDTDTLDASFQLRIDLQLLPVIVGGSNHSPIGDFSDRFEGHFDGAGHSISNLIVNASDEDYVGLFGVIGSDGSVENLEVSGYVHGDSYVGGLAGRNFGTITDTGADVTVEAEGNWAGGFVGRNSGGNIERSYATGDVDGNQSQQCGGLVGRSSGYIDETYATGDVSSDRSRCGGLVGYNDDEGEIWNSYATGDVTSTSSHIGGLVGQNYGDIWRSYSTGEPDGSVLVGGAIGSNEDDGMVANSVHWDTETSNFQDSDGGNARTTSWFADEDNFTWFDFDDTWEIGTAPDGADRPVHQWDD